MLPTPATRAESVSHRSVWRPMRRELSPGPTTSISTPTRFTTWCTAPRRRMRATPG